MQTWEITQRYWDSTGKTDSYLSWRIFTAVKKSPEAKTIASLVGSALKLIVGLFIITL